MKTLWAFFVIVSLECVTLIHRIAESEVKFPTPTFPKFPTP